nr:hypothetical protein [Tanacetum cinerariifolium]
MMGSVLVSGGGGWKQEKRRCRFGREAWNSAGYSVFLKGTTGLGKVVGIMWSSGRVVRSGGDGGLKVSGKSRLLLTFSGFATLPIFSLGVKFCAGEGGLRSWEWCGGGGVGWKVGESGVKGMARKPGSGAT